MFKAAIYCDINENWMIIEQWYPNPLGKTPTRGGKMIVRDHSMIIANNKKLNDVYFWYFFLNLLWNTCSNY